jgi:hypothetical protein
MDDMDKIISVEPAHVVTLVVESDDFDTEGHALTLRFPTAEAAEDFKKRLATGMIAATLVAGGAAAGATLAPSRTATTSEAAPAAPMARDTDRYAGRWAPGEAAPAVRDTDHYAGRWSTPQAAPAVRDTDRYTGPASSGTSAPAARDRDHYTGDWTQTSDEPTVSNPVGPNARGNQPR